MWVHRLSQRDPEKQTAVCASCGPVRIKLWNYGPQNGRRWRCAGYIKQRYEKKNGRNTGKYQKLDYCEKCGFKADDPVQLDIDHRDSNRRNGDKSNLWTLCANCHRLITKQRVRSIRQFS